jgi:4-hydroxybenzoate polyprenyltransferase
MDQVALQEISFTFFQRFFFVIAITLPFEIRDLKFDSGNLNTIPQQIGIANTKKIGYILLGIILFLEFLKSYFSVINLIALSLILLVSAYFIKAARIDQGSYYSAFWVEGIPVFWLLVWLLAKILL